MYLYLLVATGGALGACLRLGLTEWINRYTQSHYALGTLAVNVLGSFLIGIIYVLVAEKGHLPPNAKPLIMTGFLGALTTFSSFSLDTLIHIHNGQWLHAVIYTFLSVILCLISTFIAVELVRSFT